MISVGCNDAAAQLSKAKRSNAHLPIMKSQPVKSFHEKTHSSSFEESFELREFSAILQRDREAEIEKSLHSCCLLATVLQLGLHAIIGAQIQARPSKWRAHKYECDSRMPRTCQHKWQLRVECGMWQGQRCRLCHAVDIGTLFNYEINIMPTKPLKGATVASLAVCPTHPQ